MKTLKWIMWSLGVSMLFSLQLHAQKRTIIDEIAWVVGDETILLSDIENQLIYLKQSGSKVDGDPMCFIPEQMAIQKLFLRQAKIDSISPNESMVIQAAERWISQKINEVGGRERLEELLGRTISQIREERRKALREESVVQQVQQTIMGNIKVSPSEVNRFYEKVNKDSLPFMPETVEVQIVTIKPKVSVEEIDKIKAKLRLYAAEVNAGKRDFSLLARLYSQDKGSALKGGELGFYGKAELEPEFANVAFSMDPQKVSRIVQTRYGYHIMQFIEKKGDLVNVRHIMLRPSPSEEAVTAATARLDSIAHKIAVDSLSFADAARYLSYDEDTRNNSGVMVNNKASGSGHLQGTAQFQMEDLPQEIGPIVSKMKEGEVSQPFTLEDKDGNTVVAIVKLRKRNPGHRANVSQDFQIIKDFVLREKQQQALNKWIQEKQAETYIKINPKWRHCKFIYPGWIKE